MSKEYFINPVPRTDGKYTVHRHGCPLMPGRARKICLGRFNSRSEVLEKWAPVYKFLVFCPFCLKVHESDSVKSTADSEKGEDKVSFSTIQHSWMNTLFCSVS